MFNKAYNDKLQDSAIYGGVHENFKLTSITHKVAENNSEYIDFIMRSPKGFLSVKEFIPKKQSWMDNERFEKSKRDQLAKMYENYIIPFIGYKDGVLVSKEELGERYAAISEGLGENTSFKGIANWFNEKIMPLAENVDLRIKAVYDKKGYIQLPNYISASKSVEPMNVLEPGVFAQDGDQFVRPAIKVDSENEKQELESSNPF